MNEKNVMTLKAVKQALVDAGFDQISRKQNGNFIARREFYYTYGRTAQPYVEFVQNALPTATIVSSGEVWKPFRGGAGSANSSHWYVEFTFKQEE